MQRKPARWRTLGLALTLSVVARSSLAQTSTTEDKQTKTAVPAYDVAAIRVDTSDKGNMGINTRPGSMTVDNATLKMLIGFAYHTRGDLIFSLPPWAEKTHYDISAKAVEADPAVLAKLSDTEKLRMVQHLLEDRFHLRCHNETREEPAFELVQAKSGAKLTPSTPEEIKGGSMMVNNTNLEAKGVQLENLADMLADQLGRPVVDKTGLPGRYNVKLHWQREGETEAQNGSGDSAPDLMTALQEQLGLKVQEGHDPIRVLVIDHVEPPTAN